MGKILHDATMGTYDKETYSGEYNEQEGILSDLTQITSFPQKETDNLDKEHTLLSKRHNIYLNNVFNPPEESCQVREDTTRQTTEEEDT